MIDRSETRETPLCPMALQGRVTVWNARRGTHLGQRSYATELTGRTYDRKRSDQTMLKFSCESGAVHIWGIFGGRDSSDRAFMIQFKHDIAAW